MYPPMMVAVLVDKVTPTACLVTPFKPIKIIDLRLDLDYSSAS